MKAVLAVLAVLALAAPSALASSVWTVNCDPLTIQRSDPIISPGVASSHVHAVVGGTAFQRTMGNDTATNARNTTCDKYTDHSNYWCPQLYKMDAGLFYLVPFLGAVRTSSYRVSA
jgi:opacity protein-like surface antigen